MKAENVIFRNDPAINEAMSQFKQGEKPLQAVLDAFNNLGIGNITDLEELAKLVRISPSDRHFGQQLDDFIAAKMGSQIADADIPTFGMFRLKKRAAIDLLQKPDLTNFVEVFGLNCVTAQRALHLAKLEKGRISLDKQKHADLISRHTVQAETPKEMEVLRKLHAILETVRELHTSGIFQDIHVSKFRQSGLTAPLGETLQINPSLFENLKSRINQ